MLNITTEDFKKIRKVYRLSQSEYAALIGISEPYVNLIENNRKRLTEKVVSSLIAELELTDEKLERILSLYEEFDLKGEF